MFSSKTYYTPEQYLEIEGKDEWKNEYINGHIYPMPPINSAHNLITVNAAVGLRLGLKGKPWETYMCRMRVKVDVPTVYMYAYPDVVVACDKPRIEHAEDGDTLLNPTVIIEVLSPSTEAYDRGDKFAHYRRLDSLAEYVLISQDKARVEHFRRQGNGGDEWALTEVSGSDGVLRLTSIGCEIALRDMYDKVDLPDNEVVGGR